MDIFLLIDNEKALIKITGKLNNKNYLHFQKKLNKITAINQKEYNAETGKSIVRLEIDLSDCLFINHYFVNILLNFYQVFSVKNQKIEITNCSEDIYFTLTTIKLNQLIEITRK